MVDSPGWLDGKWTKDLLDGSTARETIRCGTVLPAKDYVRNAIARRRSHRHEPLAWSIAIRRRPANRDVELEQVVAAILIVDIVRSTEKKSARLGDARWTQVMNHYHAAVRRELKTLRGKEVVTTGDGLLATFLAFHIGARVAAKARAGEVLVSSAVKDVMSQSEIQFKDRGLHQLKGVPKRWRLYRVDG
jgi:class 3 adenylate cyclase